jgi:hypothetical protein
MFSCRWRLSVQEGFAAKLLSGLFFANQNLTLRQDYVI